MGLEIASADSDDLLAAWLWVTEVWFCRDWADQSVEFHEAVQREYFALRHRCRNAWPAAGDAWAPSGVRAEVQGALDQASSRLGMLMERASSLRGEAVAAWESMRDEAGLDPVAYFQRMGTRRRSPVEDAAEIGAQLEQGRREFSMAMRSLHEAVHGAALNEHARRNHVATGEIPPEGSFLRSVHSAAKEHRLRVSAEVLQFERAELRARKRWPVMPAPISLDGVSAWYPANSALAACLAKEAEASARLAERADELWDELAEESGLLTAARPDRPVGLARFAELAAVSQEVAASRGRFDLSIRQHAEAVHPLALAANRRFDWSRSGLSMSNDAIRALHHREFEHLTARLLARDGFTIEQGFGGSGDMGADVIAVSPRSGRRFVVQCKHTSGEGKVGTPDLQRFKGTVWDVHQADVALLVTNGGFSRKATAFALEHNITLLGRREIERWAGDGDAVWDLHPMPTVARIR